MKRIKKTLARRAAGWLVNAIFILGALGLAGSVLSGCEFLRGARDEGLRQAPSLVADAAPLVTDALADRIGERVGRTVGDALAKLPVPSAPAPAGGENGLLYGAGTLAALLVSNAIRGGIRRYQEKRKDDVE